MLNDEQPTDKYERLGKAILDLNNRLSEIDPIATVVFKSNEKVRERNERLNQATGLYSTSNNLKNGHKPQGT